MLRHRMTPDNGQAFIELALVLPVFTLMLVGIVEFGRLGFASIEINNAARAGVAYAAQTNTTASDSTNITLAAKQDAADFVASSLTVTPTYSCYCESSIGTMSSLASCGSADANLTTCSSPSRIAVFVQVTTNSPVATLFHFPGVPGSFNLQGQATMRVQQ
jgi:Flp pilus assembly protein TadG